jgi:hypothetical protein
MNLQRLFARFQAPEDDLGGGGASAPEPAAASTESAGPSMDDTIRDTYRSLMGEESSEKDGTEEPAATEPRHKTQPRQSGRFAKDGVQTSAPGQQTPEGEQQQASGEDGEQQTQTLEAKPHDALPNTWKKELADTWKTLPESARQEIHRREQDMHNGLRQYKDAAGFGQSLAREMAPYQGIMQKNGVTPQAIVRDIMGALNTMATGSDESKASTFLQLARTYGINLDNVMSLHSRAPSQQAPELTALKQEIGEVRNRLTQADQERELALQREDDATVQRFLNDPKNEHAKAVSAQMAGLLTSGQAKDLDDAYQQAIWLHPETRQKLLAKQDAERRKTESEQAKSARKASSTNVQRRGTPPAPARKGTMDDTIRSELRRLTGGE